MSNPFKKIGANAEATKNKQQQQADKQTASVDLRSCPQCGAPRPKNTDLRECDYCQFQFMNIDIKVNPDT